ncbi:hypothetical protein HanXRQr2_Chr06g0268781 [Helianthus annuus]|uniref:Uncharacterized protein n=1 Tax=Helianthus annuus TaxID=4232 RepID=A0A9K3IUR9_HELAN|nr:hypothetical protein HanXRQr2_Chr06g0268781 [Helianthus annuus]
MTRHRRPEQRRRFLFPATRDTPPPVQIQRPATTLGWWRTTVAESTEEERERERERAASEGEGNGGWRRSYAADIDDDELR